MNDERLYAKLTLDFADSPKIAPLSDQAFRQFVEVILWSRRLMTDGFIPDRMVNRLFDPEALEELLNNDPVNPSVFKVIDGFMIHDFGKHQITKDWVEKKREAGRKGGLAKAASSKNLAPAKDPLVAKTQQNLGEKEKEKEREKEKEDSLIPAINRPDVDSLNLLLADLIEGNGAKRPSISKKWIDECRLMLDRDGRSFEEAESLIRWSQNDSFWRSNILSMPTFRKQYDRLLLKARSEIQNHQTNAVKNLSIVEQFAAMEEKPAWELEA